jgi:hypothetical protein
MIVEFDPPVGPEETGGYWLTEGQTILVDVPVGAIVDYGGGTREGDMIRFSAPRKAAAADLMWGRYRLGRFVMDTVTGRVGDTGTHYLATLRRVERAGHLPAREPLDDDVTAWIKRHRDRWAAPTGEAHPNHWHALDALLDDYRAHRATGTPLDQDVAEH